MSSSPSSITAPSATGRRRILLLGLSALVLLAAVAWGLRWWSSGRFTVETDNAYVGGNIVQISPQTAGTVISIAADETDFVSAGTTLVTLDATDAELSLKSAEAQLGQTLREVRSLFASEGGLAAQVRLRAADLARARQDLARFQGLAGTGAVGGEELDHATSTVRSAEAALQGAREQLASNHALTEHTDPRHHPTVQRAMLKVEEAQLALLRTRVPAPVSGFVARRTAQPGQRVNIGTPLMTVVPLDQLWVDANFKESELRDMRIGQPVRLRADLYGKDVVFRGRLAGFAAGTGAAFSLLPAQNATGNWIKIVQRIPVRIALDARELAAHPLRIGLSMRADVDTHDRHGARLSSAQRHAPVAQTAVYAGQQQTASRQAASSLQRAGQNADLPGP